VFFFFSGFGAHLCVMHITTVGTSDSQFYVVRYLFDVTDRISRPLPETPERLPEIHERLPNLAESNVSAPLNNTNVIELSWCNRNLCPLNLILQCCPLVWFSAAALSQLSLKWGSPLVCVPAAWGAHNKGRATSVVTFEPLCIFHGCGLV
jgi:hypothetical protein